MAETGAPVISIWSTTTMTVTASSIRRGPQLTGQHRQGMHPTRAHRVRAYHPQPPCRFVPGQAWRSAAQPGQDIIGWQRGALRRRHR